MLENKEKKKREEINKFFKAAEKCFAFSYQDPQLFGQISTPNLNNASVFNTVSVDSHRSSSLPPESKDRILFKKKKSANTPTNSKKDDSTYFLKLVEKYRTKFHKSPFIISLQRQILDLELNSPGLYQITDIQVPKGQPDEHRDLVVDDDIWQLMPYKGLTSEQKYRKYKKLIGRAQKRQDSSSLKTTGENNETKNQTVPNERIGFSDFEELARELECDEMKEDIQLKEVSESKDANEVSELSEAEEYKFGDCQIGIQAAQIFSEPESPLPKPLVVASSATVANTEFRFRMVKLSYLQKCAGDSTLPFDLSFLTASLLIDDVEFADTLVCACKRPYRGEVLLSKKFLKLQFF